MVDQVSLESRFEENLRSLKQYFPDLYEFYSDYKEQRYVLVYDANGDYNIYDMELSDNIYPAKPLEYCATTLQEYRTAPIFFSKLLGGATDLANSVNPVHTDYVIRLANISAAQSAVAPVRELFPDKIKFMTFLGVGAGHDVEYILKEKTISNVCIMEKEPDIFYASLFLVNWASIFERYNVRGKKLSIIVSNDSSDIVAQFYKVVVRYGHYSVNAMFLYSPVNIDGYEELYKEISELIRGRLLGGFGFYDDSRLSVAATINNVRNEIPLYVNKKGLKDIIVSKDMPVFIVGAGPSLDNDIDFIKKNQNKALIISCGSGIKPLEKNNIIPDFHFECERTAFTKHWLDQVDKDFMKKVNFIGLNVIYPDVYDMFKRTGMMAKSNETGSFMLAKAIQRCDEYSGLPMHTHVNPTVVHMGIGVTPFLGLKKLYLFGVDMGYKDPENHHSKDSSYSDLKESSKDIFKPTKYKEVESNFESGPVYTDDGYIGFRLFLEGIIQSNNKIFKDFEAFNCSDGALIKGAVPLEDRSFLDHYKAIDKEKISTGIMDEYFDDKVCREVLSGLEEISKEDVEIVYNACMKMSEHFSTKVESISDADMLLDSAINRLFHSDELFIDEKAYLLSLFSGSMLYMFSTMTRIIYSRTGSEQANIDAANPGFKLISDFFKAVGDDFTNNYMKNDDISLYDLF